MMRACLATPSLGCLLTRIAVPVLVALFAAATPASAEQLMGGIGLVDVSPKKLPVTVNGGFTTRSFEHLHDPLHARCLALRKGDERVALVVVDSCMIPRGVCDQVKALAQADTGIPVENILISATHTHSAPSLMDHCLGTSQDRTYVRQIVPQIAEAIRQADSQMEPVSVGWAVVDAPRHTHCRRWIRRPDRVGEDPFGSATIRAMMHPGYQNADYLGPAGPADSCLTLLSVRRHTGAPLCVFANYSMHYFGSVSGVSADYFGAFAEVLSDRILGDAGPREGDKEQAATPFLAVMSQGTSGDLHWMNYGKPRRELSLKQYATELAEIAHQTYQDIQYHDDVPLAMRTQELTLSRRMPSEERLAWARPINTGRAERAPRNLQEVYAQQAEWIHENPTETLVLQAVRIGDVGITAIPNEVYSVTGLRIKAQSPLPLTFNIELANGAAGYIPPPIQHRLGGYTTWPARTAGLEVQAEPQIVDVLLSLLEQISDQPRRTLNEDLYPPSIRENMRRVGVE